VDEPLTREDVGPVVTGTMILCDFAQSINGKLYVMGGGWNQIQRPPGVRAVNVFVAVKLDVPWDLANHRMDMSVRLMTDEGEAVDVGLGPVEARGEVEVARGLGLRHGTALISTFVIPFALPDLNSGGYVFELRLRDRIVATEPLTVA
jgi:hypothetical protein